MKFTQEYYGKKSAIVLTFYSKLSSVLLLATMSINVLARIKIGDTAREVHDLGH